MREYEIHPAGGIPTTIQLDEEEAKRLGLTEKKAPVKTKQPVETKQHTPLNKSVTPKSGDAGS